MYKPCNHITKLVLLYKRVEIYNSTPLIIYLPLEVGSILRLFPLALGSP